LAASAGRPTSHTIRNVNSHSLGVVGKDPRTGQNRNGIVIPRNTAIPISRERVFRTERHNQRSVVVQVVEGESPLPDDCTPIGQFAIDGLPPLPAGSPVVVSFHYECNGRLNVQVALPGTNRQVAAEIKRAAGLDKQQLDGWRRYISGMEPTDH
jgi:molecular chaperone DnaK (HSP70)